MVKKIALIVMMATVSVILSSFSSEAVTEDLYKVGVNDVIGISVLDNRELNTQATVSLDGTITFPFIGSVDVKGKTIPAIEEEITRRLGEGYVKFPVVTVSLLRSMSRRVFTYGEFRRIGELHFLDGMTVSVAFSLTGGVSDNGLNGMLKVNRKHKETGQYEKVVAIRLDNGVIQNEKVENMLLQPDDILLLERNDTFFIHGEVMRVGRHVIEENMTVVKALSVAGGIKDSGLYGKVKVRRKKQGKSGYVDIVESDVNNGIINRRDIEDMSLEPEDILIVERSKTFFIHGEVVSPGHYVLEKDMTVERALSVARGLQDNGLYGKIKIRRLSEGTVEYKDVAEATLNNGIISKREAADILIHPDDILIVERSKTVSMNGEVARVGQIAVEHDMTVAKALSVAGGIKENGLYGRIKIRRLQKDSNKYEDVLDTAMNNGLIGDIEAEDMLLQPDDIVLVERNKAFFIYGEVNRPGEYVLKNNMTVFNGITVAGGFSKWGSPNRVDVLRQSEDNNGLVKIKVNIKDVIEGDSSKDVILIPGDTIVVSSSMF